MKNKEKIIKIDSPIVEISINKSKPINKSPVCSVKEREFLDRLIKLEEKTGKKDFLERAVNIFEGRTRKRPEVLQGCTYKIAAYTPNKVNYYITLNHVVERGKRFIYEIFINTSEVSHIEWISVITRQLSALFKLAKDRDLKYDFIIKSLKKTFSNKSYFARGLKMNVSGVQAHIGIIIEKHIEKLAELDEKDRIFQKVIEDGGFSENGDFQDMINGINAKVVDLSDKVEKFEDKDIITNDLAFCPECNTFGLRREGGCSHCINCGFDQGCG